jgi:hypothetical protein
MAEKLLNLAHVNGGIEQACRGGGPGRVGRIYIPAPARILQVNFVCALGQLPEIPLHDAKHFSAVHETVGKILAARVPANDAKYFFYLPPKSLRLTDAQRWRSK